MRLNWIGSRVDLGAGAHGEASIPYCGTEAVASAAT
jgi:hypothetical protein